MRIGWLLLALLLPAISFAQTNWVTLGEGTARWGLFKLYNATLSAPEGISREQLFDEETPLKLELCYLRRLTVENFVDGANHALSKQTLSPSLELAVDRLHQAYQPVNQGDCYLLSFQPGVGTQLILNQRSLVTIDLVGFKAVYFGIWLGDPPLSTQLKNALLENL